MRPLLSLRQRSRLFAQEDSISSEMELFYSGNAVRLVKYTSLRLVSLVSKLAMSIQKLLTLTCAGAVGLNKEMSKLAPNDA
jgi:hypothetical protein